MTIQASAQSDQTLVDGVFSIQWVAFAEGNRSKEAVLRDLKKKGCSPVAYSSRPTPFLPLLNNTQIDETPASPSPLDQYLLSDTASAGLGLGGFEHKSARSRSSSTSSRSSDISLGGSESDREADLQPRAAPLFLPRKSMDELKSTGVEQALTSDPVQLDKKDIFLSGSPPEGDHEPLAVDDDLAYSQLPTFDFSSISSDQLRAAERKSHADQLSAFETDDDDEPVGLFSRRKAKPRSVSTRDLGLARKDKSHRSSSAYLELFSVDTRKDPRT